LNNDEYGFNHRFVHQDGKSQEMQVNQNFWQAFIIPRNLTKARCPTKTALHYPASGQQAKTIFYIRQLDYLQTDTFTFRDLCGLPHVLVLIHEDHLDGHQGLIRSHKAPLIITDIIQISFSFHALTSTISRLKIHNTLY